MVDVTKAAHTILQDAKPGIIRQVKKALEKIGKADEAAENAQQANTLANNLDLDALDAFTFDNFDNRSYFVLLIQDEFEKSGNEFLAEINIPEKSPSFSQVSDAAVAYMKDHGGQLISQLDTATRNDIAATIAQGLDAGKSAEQIADSLQDIYSFSETRANLIAETEIGNANSNAVVAGMKLLANNGVKIKKKWIPDELACDICIENGEAGFIELGEEFPGGVLAPLQHPRCRCDLGSKIED
jgi:Phage Mu protein F like protein